MPNQLSDQSAEIVKRWFYAFDKLEAKGKIKSIYAFAKSHNISRPGLIRLREEPTRKFELQYLAILVNNYQVNAHWLITGLGPKGV